MVAVTNPSAAGNPFDVDSYTDISGTPGPGTVNTNRGKAAFAASGASVVITNPQVNAASSVFVSLTATAADATLTSVVRVAPGSGSFTVYGNAAATAAVPFTFIVLN